MLFQYPLETLARLRRADSQLRFATEAKALLRDDDEHYYEPLEHGLAIFAAHEEALSESAVLLHEAYGDFVEIRRPRVRMIPGSPPQQPVMAIRVRLPRRFAGQALQRLRLRGVAIVEECYRARELIVRGEAPLADLLGIGGELVDASEGTAEYWVRLSRYAPSPPPPFAA